MPVNVGGVVRVSHFSCSRITAVITESGRLIFHSKNTRKPDFACIALLSGNLNWREDECSDTQQSSKNNCNVQYREDWFVAKKDFAARRWIEIIPFDAHFGIKVDDHFVEMIIETLLQPQSGERQYSNKQYQGGKEPDVGSFIFSLPNYE